MQSEYGNVMTRCVCVGVCVRACVFVHVSVCVFVCVSVWVHVCYYYYTCVYGMSQRKLRVGCSSHWSGMEPEFRPTSNLLVNHKGQRVKLSDQAGGLAELLPRSLHTFMVSYRYLLLLYSPGKYYTNSLSRCHSVEMRGMWSKVKSLRSLIDLLSGGDVLVESQKYWTFWNQCRHGFHPKNTQGRPLDDPRVFHKPDRWQTQRLYSHSRCWGILRYHLLPRGELSRRISPF